MQQLNISVSKLTAFDDYLHGRWNQEDDARLRDYLMGVSVATFEKDRGTALHAFVEAPERYSETLTSSTETEIIDGQPIDFFIPETGFDIDGIWLSKAIARECLRFRQSLPQPFLFEQWLTAPKLEVKGYEINLRARVDILTPQGIRDVKTTESTFDHDRYADSFQWRLYLMMSGFDTFDYDIFQFREKGQAVRYNNIRLYGYEGLKKDCLRLIEGLVEYCHDTDLIHTLFSKQVQTV